MKSLLLLLGMFVLYDVTQGHSSVGVDPSQYCPLVEEAQALVKEFEQMCPNTTDVRMTAESMCKKFEKFNDTSCMDVGHHRHRHCEYARKFMSANCNMDNVMIDPTELCPYLPMADFLLTEIDNMFCSSYKTSNAHHRSYCSGQCDTDMDCGTNCKCSRYGWCQ